MGKKLPIEVLEYFRRQGAKGGKAGAKRRMEVLSPAQRSEIARKAAAARWAPVTQSDLKRQTVLQADEWEADRAAQMGAEDINVRIAAGAEVKPGKLTFDKKRKMATAAEATAAQPAVPVVAPKRRSHGSKPKRADKGGR